MPLNLTEEQEEELAYILLGEAGGEGRAGMEAVMHVMVNRTKTKEYPDSLYGVATQGSGSQFNAARSASLEASKREYPEESFGYRQAKDAIKSVVSGTRVDPTGGALHFYANQGPNKIKEPGWFPKVASAGAIQIGNHVFASKRPVKQRTVTATDTRGALAPYNLTHLTRTVRALDGLPAANRAVLLPAVIALADAGLDPVVVQGFRSKAEQDALFRSGKGVTRAKGGQSYHNHGAAIDIVPASLLSKKNWEPDSPLWEQQGKIVSSLPNLRWGGDFKSLYDPAHVEIASPLSAFMSPSPATMSVRLAALREGMTGRVASIPLPRRPPQSLIAETSEPQTPLRPMERLASRRPTMREMQAIRQTQFAQTTLAAVPQGRALPVSQGVAAGVPPRTVVGREPTTTPAQVAQRTAALPSGKEITIGQVYRIGAINYVGGVDETGRGQLQKVDPGILKEAGKPTIAGGLVDQAMREGVTGGVRGAGTVTPGAVGAVAGATKKVVDAMGNVVSGPVSAITGAMSKIVWVTETIRVRNPAYKSAIKPVPVAQTVITDRLGIPTGEVGFRSFGELGAAPAEPEFIEQQVVVQRTVPVSAAPRPRVLPSAPTVPSTSVPTSYVPRGSNTIYTNPTKYGATSDERRARAARRQRLENFGGGEGSGPSGVAQSLVG